MELVPRDIMTLNQNWVNAKSIYGEQLWEKTRTGRLKNNCKSSISAFIISSPFSTFKEKEGCPNNALNSIIYPSNPSDIELSNYVNQSLYEHVVQWIYHISGLMTGLKWIYHISGPMTGAKWKKAVRKNWELARECICESCVRRTFTKHWYGSTSATTQSKVADVVEKIMEEDSLWSSMFHDSHFDGEIKAHVELVEAFSHAELHFKVPKPCMCARIKRNIKRQTDKVHCRNDPTSITHLDGVPNKRR